MEVCTEENKVNMKPESQTGGVKALGNIWVEAQDVGTQKGGRVCERGQEGPPGRRTDSIEGTEVGQSLVN